MTNYNRRSKSKPGNPHLGRDRAKEKKPKKLGALAERIFSCPIMRVGVVHFL